MAAGEKQATADYRISKRYSCFLNHLMFADCWSSSVCLICSAWLKGSANCIVEKLDQRISALTGLNVTHPYGEYLQVVNYGIGGHYEPHFDHATVSYRLLVSQLLIAC